MGALPPLTAALVVLGAAWAFGAVEPYWSLLAASCVLAVLAADLVASAARRRATGLPRNAVLVLVAFSVVPLVTLVPLPGQIHGWLNAASSDLWATVAGPDGARPLSLHPLSTLRASVLAAAVAGVAWLGARAAATNSGASAVRWAVLAGGAALAVFGLTQRLVDYDAQTIYWSIPLEDVGTPFGPYVNRNHFAGAMVLFGGVAAGVTLEALATRSRSRAVVSGCVLAVVLVALAATTSRGGFLGACVAVIVLLWAARGAGRRRLALAATGLAGLALAALTYAGLGGQWVRTFVTAAVKTRWQNRFLVQADALRLFGDHPLTGTGAGTFELAYPPFQTVADGRHFGDAHSDWAQFLAETGLLGLALGAAVLWVVLPPIVRVVRSDAPGRWLVAGPAAGVAGIVVHGFLEVNLHVPANALLAALVLSLAYGAALRLTAVAAAVPADGASAPGACTGPAPESGPEPCAEAPRAGGGEGASQV